MGVVMLHRVHRQRARGSEVEGEPGAEEIGMQVMGDGLGVYVEHVAQMLHRLDERAAGRGVVEVADVRRQECFVATRDADGVLQPGAGGEHRGA